MPWLPVGLVVAVAVAVAVTVDQTVFSEGAHTNRTTSSLALDPADEAAATVIARYRERIPELMAEQGIPGLAVALVNRDRALWVEGFGHVDGGGSAPVTADTIFSVQSMSKLFTATAVMQAVAAGRLDLDVPITAYLPEFTVNSAFEEHPERKITLRMLLGHTAGFTHEAPVGNNNELDPATSTPTFAASPRRGCAFRSAADSPTRTSESTLPATSSSESKAGLSRK